MKKKIFLLSIVTILLLGFATLGFSYFVGANAERFQGIGGKPVSVAYMDDNIYIYDSGSGEVYSGCWCALAGIVLTKPVIWVVNPESKSIEDIILKENPQFSSIRERIKNTLANHLITVNDELLRTSNGWTIQLQDYKKVNRLWADKKLIIKDPGGLLTELRPITQKFTLLRLDQNNIPYVFSLELVPIDDPEDITKFYTGEISPRVQNEATNKWNRVDDVLLVVDLDSGTIRNSYTLGESYITSIVYSNSDDLMFDDDRYLYVKRSGSRIVVDDYTPKTFVSVFDKEQNIIRSPSAEEEYALLSLSFWLDKNWIVAARTDGDDFVVNPIGNAKLRITDRKTDVSTDITLDVFKNKLSRLAYGTLNISFGLLFFLAFAFN